MLVDRSACTWGESAGKAKALTGSARDALGDVVQGHSLKLRRSASFEGVGEGVSLKKKTRNKRSAHEQKATHVPYHPARRTHFYCFSA